MRRLLAGLFWTGLLLSQSTAQDWLAKGDAQFAKHDFAAAKQSFQQAIELDGHNFLSYRALGLAELELRDYNAAYRAWLKANELDSNDLRTKYYLGRLFYEADLPNEAAAWLRQVVTADPHDYAAQTYLGLSAAALSFDDTADGLYRKAIYESNQQQKPFSWAYLGLANLLIKRGDESQALTVLNETRERCPEPQALSLLGELLMKTSNKKQAEQVLREAIRLDPNLSRAHYRLALLLKAQGKNEEAKSEMEIFQRTKSQEAALPKPQALRK